MKVDTKTIEKNKSSESSVPRVSVVMPAYNRASLIVESIQSVLSQEFIDLELIIVDDGSTDATREIVLSLEDSRIRYVYQDNCGVVVARNTGLGLARGEYVFFLDSDDILLGNAIEKAIKVMDKHPEVAFCYGQAYLMDEKRRIFGLRRQRGRQSYVRKGIWEIEKATADGNYIPTSTIMVRRTCLSKVGFFDNAFHSGSEDFELWVRLARSYSVAYIAEPLVKYRVHNSSITSARRLAEIEKSNSIIIERILNDPEICFSLSLEKSRVYVRMYQRLAYYAYGGRDMKISRDYLFRSLRTQPEWYMKVLWLPLIIRLMRTWLPPSYLNLGHRIKHSLCIMAFTFCFRQRSRRRYEK